MLLFFDQAEQRAIRERVQRLADFNAAVAGGKEGKALYQALLDSTAKED